jgi:vitamin B12 transporter
MKTSFDSGSKRPALKSWLSVFASLIFFGTAVVASAQSSSPDVQLTGTLLDSSGAGVGGVQVVAQLANDPQAHLWKATSSTDGAYSLTLPPGRYRVIFQRRPFVARVFDLDLTRANSPRTLDLRLDLERLSSSVVVTAQAQPLPIQQTTAPVDVMTREDIAARLAVTLPDILLSSPGVAIGRTGPEGGSASIFLNGGGSAYTKVLVDGTPVNEPGNAVDFANFTLDNVDKIEVVRGAESAVYGSDAVSGVIQVFTHRGMTRIPEFAVFAEGGNFDTGRGGAQLSGLIGKFDYSGAASYFSTNGPQDINAFINRTLSGNFGYRLGEDNQLRLSLRNNTSNGQTPGQVLLEPASPDSHTDYQFFSSNARWDFAAGRHWHHQLMGAESYNRQFTADPIQSFFIQGTQSFCPQSPASPHAVPTAQFCDFTDPGSRYQYNRASLNAQSSYLLENFSATAGYQYEIENASIPSLAEGHVRRNNQAGFLDFRYAPHARASLDFGLRAEANGYFGTRVVPRAGASLALLQGRGFWGETRLRAFYGQGIKEPRFDQIFDDAFGDIGNPNLKPESSKTWTVGIDQKLDNDRIRLTGEYFSTRFYNMISFAFCLPLPSPDTGNSCGVTVPPGTPASFGYFFNTDRARARGTNITAQARVNRWLMVKGNYTYDDSLILVAAEPFDPTQLPGNRLARRPVNSGSLTAQSSWRHLGVSFSGYFSGQRTDSDFLFLGLTRTPGYARFDLATTYQLGHGVSTYLRAANLFDKSYQDALGYPALGREVRVGMAYRFGGKN